jgi:hypothetical protein
MLEKHAVSMRCVIFSESYAGPATIYAFANELTAVAPLPIRGGRN